MTLRVLCNYEGTFIVGVIHFRGGFNDYVFGLWGNKNSREIGCEHLDERDLVCIMEQVGSAQG